MSTTITLRQQANGLYTTVTTHTVTETDIAVTIVDDTPPVIDPPAPVLPVYLFFDDFTTKNLKTSMNGISWSGSNAGSGDKPPVVTMENPYNGKPSLKFTFGGGGPDDDAWCEQRIKFQTPLTELWVAFMLYCPSGAETVNVGPKWVHRRAPGPNNNKFFHIWSGNYQTAPTKMAVGSWTDGARDIYYPNYGSNQINGVGQFGLPQAPPRPDTVLGRWVPIQLHFKCASAANNDGIIQMWDDGVLVLDNTNVPAYPKDGISNAFTEGYLMGWMNSGFDVETYCYIANFIIDDKPL